MSLARLPPFTLSLNANSTIDDLNGGAIRNCPNIVATSQYKTADGQAVKASTSVAQPYNGQWFQLNVLSSKIK